MAKKWQWAKDIGREEAEWVRAEDCEEVGERLERPVVLVNGAFDLLHIGHMRVLWQAKKQGKSVVLALDSDEKIKGRKGAGRPVLNWIERAAVMDYMPVDVVVEVDSDEDMRMVVEGIKPDVRVLGEEYRYSKSRWEGNWKTVFVRGAGISTTKIINRCKGI